MRSIERCPQSVGNDQGHGCVWRGLTVELTPSASGGGSSFPGPWIPRGKDALHRASAQRGAIVGKLPSPFL